MNRENICKLIANINYDCGRASGAWEYDEYSHDRIAEEYWTDINHHVGVVNKLIEKPIEMMSIEDILKEYEDDIRVGFYTKSTAIDEYVFETKEKIEAELIKLLL